MACKFLCDLFSDHVHELISYHSYSHLPWSSHTGPILLREWMKDLAFAVYFCLESTNTFPLSPKLLQLDPSHSSYLSLNITSQRPFLTSKSKEQTRHLYYTFKILCIVDSLCYFSHYLLAYWFEYVYCLSSFNSRIFIMKI